LRLCPYQIDFISLDNPGDEWSWERLRYWLPAKIMAFTTWTYQIEGVCIDTPEDKGCQEGAQILACPVEGNLEEKNSNIKKLGKFS
jgi:hypothetical protein